MKQLYPLDRYQLYAPKDVETDKALPCLYLEPTDYP